MRKQDIAVATDYKKEPAMQDVEDHFVDPYTFSDEELAAIAAGCEIFPGRWFVDPAIDYRRVGAPRVWIHPTAGNDTFNLSFGFSKEENIFQVAIQPHANSGDFPTQGIRFGTLRDALTMCQENLAIVLKQMGKDALEKYIRAASGKIGRRGSKLHRA